MSDPTEGVDNRHPCGDLYVEFVPKDGVAESRLFRWKKPFALTGFAVQRRTFAELPPFGPGSYLSVIQEEGPVVLMVELGQVVRRGLWPTLLFFPPSALRIQAKITQPVTVRMVWESILP